MSVKVWPTTSLSGYNVKTDKGDFYIENKDVVATNTYPKSAKYPYKVQAVSRKVESGQWPRYNRAYILMDKCSDMSRSEFSEVVRQICAHKQSVSTKGE